VIDTRSSLHHGVSDIAVRVEFLVVLGWCELAGSIFTLFERDHTKDL